MKLLDVQWVIVALKGLLLLSPAPLVCIRMWPCKGTARLALAATIAGILREVKTQYCAIWVNHAKKEFR